MSNLESSAPRSSALGLSGGGLSRTDVRLGASAPRAPTAPLAVAGLSNRKVGPAALVSAKPAASGEDGGGETRPCAGDPRPCSCCGESAGCVGANMAAVASLSSGCAGDCGQLCIPLRGGETLVELGALR